MTSAQPLSLGIELTPNRKAEIEARVDSLTQDKATAPGAKMIAIARIISLARSIHYPALV